MHNDEVQEWSVYSLHDPRTRVIRYVGITERPLAVRYSQHMHDRGSAKKFAWISELRLAGLKPIMRRLAFFDGGLSEAEACEAAWMDLVEAKYGAVLLNVRRAAKVDVSRQCKRQREIRAAGLCTKCWKRRDGHSTSFCEACRLKENARRNRRRAAQRRAVAS